MWILQGHLYGRTRTVQVKSGMSIDSHPESYVLVGHLYGRTRTVQVKSGMSIDSYPESCVLVQTASLYSPGKYVNWNLSFFNGDPV